MGVSSEGAGGCPGVVGGGSPSTEALKKAVMSSLLDSVHR